MLILHIQVVPMSAKKNNIFQIDFEKLPIIVYTYTNTLITLVHGNNIIPKENDHKTKSIKQLFVQEKIFFIE